MQLTRRLKSRQRPAAPERATGASGAAAPAMQSLLAAALALPGLGLAPSVHAETAPESAVFSFRHLEYVDYQRNGGKRISVSAPSAYFLIPAKTSFAVEGSYTLDSVSGASPIYHSTLSGASGTGISERRKAGDIKGTYYWDRVSVGVRYSNSTEHDYDSNAVAIEAKFATQSQNTTFAIGVGGARDRIRSTNDPTLDESRKSQDYFFGVTQVLSPNAILQSNVQYSPGKGYFSDPYKSLDFRPSDKRSFTWLTRHLQYVPATGGALHSSYRYYRNDWGVMAHQFEFAYYQPFGEGWTIRPRVRYAAQRAADFYRDPTFPTGYVPGEFYSADSRLGSFGAVTLGLKVAKTFKNGLTVDAKYERYEQRADWRVGGPGSPGLEPFQARWWSVGLTKQF